MIFFKSNHARLEETMNRFLTATAVALAIGVSTVPAFAKTNDYQNTGNHEWHHQRRRHDLNKTWTDRPGVKKSIEFTVNAAAKDDMEDDDVTMFQDRGAKDFHKHVKEMGKKAACKEIDQLIKEMADVS